MSRFGAPTLKAGSRTTTSRTAVASRRSRSGAGSSAKAIPDAVAQRMARRIALATGIPTLMGMGVFVGSYLLITRGIADIPTSATLIASGGCFLLGLLGLSYGVLSASWEEPSGSLLGFEQIGLNINRLRQSIGAMRQGNQ
ncbi:MAG: photosystem II biosynthesis protein [Cyanobium sp.]